MSETIIKRLSEPSTWAGLAGLALAIGLSAEDFQIWANGAAGFFGFLAIAFGEKGDA